MCVSTGFDKPIFVCLISGIACLLNKMGRKEATVGVDGSLYRFHPFFHDLMMEKISHLIKPNLSVSSPEDL